MYYDIKCQIIIIGDSTVGKTSIITRYSNGTFDSNYLATVGIDTCTKDENINGKIVRVKIWDTAGEERFKTLTNNFFRNAEGVILVYDVTNTETYSNLKFWIQSIKTNMGENTDTIPIIILGNKIDCETREIFREEAEAFAKGQNFHYFETSAKTGENVDSSIKFLINLIMSQNSEEEEKNNNITITKEEENNNNNDKCGC